MCQHITIDRLVIPYMNEVEGITTMPVSLQDSVHMVIA